ncbi:uncharacterized protein RCC_09945 [Ramularia collo-cygni]|uniref:Uncharacterized protein n=1 Tax=Ramularia collo-cygni TaxID=112498 RepID=A0A2D3V1M5_9PEZI|nr:uncharacterized protein RCC_09945 [Ramularia collo-cygni]CZT24227.1 uncharacterized protein RCC_09945 [Ramularia collo-cygni]
MILPKILKISLLALVAICLITPVLGSPNQIEKRIWTPTPPTRIPLGQQRCASLAFLSKGKYRNWDLNYIQYDVYVGREYSRAKCMELQNNLRTGGLSARYDRTLGELVQNLFFRCSPTLAGVENHLHAVFMLRPGQEVTLNKVLAKTFPVVNKKMCFTCLGNTTGG